MFNDPSQESFAAAGGIHSTSHATQKKKDGFSFARGPSSHVYIQSYLNSSPSEFTGQHSTEAIHEGAQPTPFVGIPFRNVASIDYKNMKMMSVRRYNQILNSPERDTNLQSVSNSYLSPQ